ncbi:MAG: hypothetical protein ACTS8S_01015 [Giesbergeria sp.]
MFSIHFLKYGRVRIDQIATIIGAFLLLNIFGLLVRLYFIEDALRDLSETVRWIFVLFFVLYLNSDIEKKEVLALRLIAFFVIMNAIVSWMQFATIPWVDFLTEIYGAQNHIEMSLGISSRALGFAAGPGQNGATAIIFGTYAFVMYYFKYQEKVFSFLLLLLTFLTMMLSQSQTSFGALIGAIFIVLMAGRFYFPKKYRLPNWYIFAAVVSLGILFYKLIDDLGYLDSLFTFGLGRSSYQGRELKWAEFFDQANESPWLYIFGHGKSYFGLSSGAMDSDYVFVLMVYGVVVFCALYGLIMWSLIWAYKDIKKGSGEALAYAGVVVCGLISAWPNAFFTDGRIAVVFLISLYTWINSRRILKSRNMVIRNENIYQTPWGG